MARLNNRSASSLVRSKLGGIFSSMMAVYTVGYCARSYYVAAGSSSRLSTSFVVTPPLSYPSPAQTDPLPPLRMSNVMLFDPIEESPENGNKPCINYQSRMPNRSNHRRKLLQKSLTFGSLLATTPLSLPSPAFAKNNKSRTTGYAIQHSESEWQQILSSQQYFILRQGGTEPPYSSILEGEDRNGLYVCAGCGTPLFNAGEKFHSGTGWPSFAKPISSSSPPNAGNAVSNVQMEDVSQIQYQLAGAEVRCRTCGGHLGDVFADGFLFVGTPAFVTGKRYCIDGGALIFVPKEQSSGGDGGELEMVRGDLPPKNGKVGVFPG